MPRIAPQIWSSLFKILMKRPTRFQDELLFEQHDLKQKRAAEALPVPQLTDHWSLQHYAVALTVAAVWNMWPLLIVQYIRGMKHCMQHSVNAAVRN